MLRWLSGNWRQWLLLLMPICIAYAVLLALEGVAISWIDRWLPITTFEAARWSALFVTAGTTWIRFCLVGLGIYLILRRAAPADWAGPRFGIEWGIGSAAVTLAILALDLCQHELQYSSNSYSGVTVRSILLLSIYAKILLAYPGVRLLLGAASSGKNPKARGLLVAWSATSLVESTCLFFLLVVLKLTIENVLVSVLSYMPFVAPFWFVPDELSRLRHFVGQGTRIVAESFGVMFYVAFFVVFSKLDERTTRKLGSTNEISRS